MRRAAAVTLIATGAVLAITLAPRNDPRPDQPPSEAQVVGYINKHRALHTLPPVATSSSLQRATERWSRRLSQTGLFAHAALRLRSRWSWLSETLYRGQGGPVRPWLRSPPHRAILLSPKARLVGIGHSGNVYVGRFGAR